MHTHDSHSKTQQDTQYCSDYMSPRVCVCVLSLPLLPVCHWLISAVSSASSGFVLGSFPSGCLSVRLLPYIPHPSLSGSSMHREQISRWFPAGIRFLRHSYFYCTVVTLNYSPLSQRTFSALTPTEGSCENKTSYFLWVFSAGNAWIKQMYWFDKKWFYLHIISLICCAFIKSGNPVKIH